MAPRRAFLRDIRVEIAMIALKVKDVNEMSRKVRPQTFALLFLPSFLPSGCRVLLLHSLINYKSLNSSLSIFSPFSSLLDFFLSRIPTQSEPVTRRQELIHPERFAPRRFLI